MFFWDNLRSSLNFINDIREIKNNNERAIYILRYIAVLSVIVCCVSMFYFGSSGAGYLSQVFEGFKTHDFNRKLYGDVKSLESNEARINTVLRRIDSMKYPSRDMLRTDINADLERAGFEVRSFTPVEVDTDIQARGGRRSAVNVRNDIFSDVIDIEVTGRIKTDRLLDLISLFDRKDRFWYLSSITIRGPEGASDFFGRAYASLDASKRAELFNLYEQSGDREYVSVVFNFRTFVRQR